MNISRISIMRTFGVVISCALMLILASCKQDSVTGAGTPNPGGGNPPIISPIPKSPPTMTTPADNKPLDLNAEIELGRHLFYDKAMSVDNSTSCATCHQAGNGFSDNLPVSMGFNNQHGTRNAPTLTNIGFNTSFTWDGRFPSLEKHAPGPIFNSLEMGNNFSTTVQDTVPSDYNSGPGSNDTLFLFSRLDGEGIKRDSFSIFRMRGAESDPNSKKVDSRGFNYHQLLDDAWGPITIKTSTDGGKTFTTKTTVAFTMDIIAKSIAAFERTLVSTQSSFDRYNNGDQTAISDFAKEGFKIFIDPAKGNCVSCHSGYNFTDQDYHNNGINGADGISRYPVQNDVGRGDITKSDADNFKFKTPTLRNVSKTAPWMHDGRFATSNTGGAEMGLENIIRSNYDRKNPPVYGQDPRVKPIGLTDQEVAYLGAFLMTLEDDTFASATNPAFMNPWNN